MRPYIPISGHALSAINDATTPQIETSILEDRPVIKRQLVYEVNINLGSVENIIYEHMHMLKRVCLMDSSVAHNFTEARTGQVS